MKKQTDIARKQYQGLDKAFTSNKNTGNVNQSLINKETIPKTIPKKIYDKPSLIYNRLIFYSYSDDKKFDSLSFESKYSYLLNFYDDLEKFNNVKVKI